MTFKKKSVLKLKKKNWNLLMAFYNYRRMPTVTIRKKRSCPVFTLTKNSPRTHAGVQAPQMRFLLEVNRRQTFTRRAEKNASKKSTSL